jgi:hypothetical protein
MILQIAGGILLAVLIISALPWLALTAAAVAVFLLDLFMRALPWIAAAVAVVLCLQTVPLLLRALPEQRQAQLKSFGTDRAARMKAFIRECIAPGTLELALIVFLLILIAAYNACTFAPASIPICTWALG